MTPIQLEETIAHLRAQNNDDAHVEVKQSGQKLSNDVWETVSAFANTSGGTIILGLSEKNHFTPDSSFDIQRNLDAFVTGIGDGGADNCKMSNPPHYKLQRMDFENAQLIVIEITENETGAKPCYITAKGIAGGSYKRVDDKDIHLSPTELFELQSILTPHDDDRSVVQEARSDDFDQDIINRVINSARARGSKAVKGINDQDALMARLNFTDNNGNVRLAGILVAGNYPQQYFPKLVVDVASFPDVEKSAPGQVRFLDRKICEGPLPEVIDDAIAAIERNLRTYSVVTGTGRTDEQEIPREVLREALVNAIVHREYNPAFIGQSVAVEIYPDRLTITNPGGLWGGKTLETLDDGNSKCRNATLMMLMRDVDLNGNTGAPAEGNGTGINLMFREMASRALPAPDFKAGIDYFTVTLGRQGVEMSKYHAWLDENGCGALPQHEKAILLAVYRVKTMSVKQLREALGIDSDEIRMLAQDLVARSMINEIQPDIYCLRENSEDNRPITRGANPRAIAISYIQEHDSANIRELAAAMGKSLSSARYYVNKLIAEKLIIPTAGATSVNRRYRLK